MRPIRKTANAVGKTPTLTVFTVFTLFALFTALFTALFMALNGAKNTFTALAINVHSGSSIVTRGKRVNPLHVLVMVGIFPTALADETPPSKNAPFIFINEPPTSDSKSLPSMEKP